MSLEHFRAQGHSRQTAEIQDRLGLSMSRHRFLVPDVGGRVKRERFLDAVMFRKRLEDWHDGWSSRWAGIFLGATWTAHRPGKNERSWNTREALIDDVEVGCANWRAFQHG